MSSIDQATMGQGARGPKRAALLAAIGGPQFIVAQMFTILATILGVYLAGYVGYQRTLEYDRLVKAREQAHLLRAMHAELTDNTVRLRAHVPKLEATFQGHGVHGDWPRLHLYIWNASADNPAVFQIPPQTLSRMQGFYETIGAMLKDDHAHEMFRRLTTSNAFERRGFTDRFDEQLSEVETSLLPSLERTAGAAEDIVRAYSRP